MSVLCSAVAVARVLWRPPETALGGPITIENLMYAILLHGGHQYRVAPGDRLLVNRLASEVGSTIELAPVLFLSEKEGAPGTADAAGATVSATVVAHRRGPKLRVFKYKAKKRNRRTIGHRSDLTELRVDGVQAASGGARKARAAATED